MSAGFQDITIVDLDVHKTTWSRVHSSMRTLYLKLSREPDQAWSRFFFEERASRVELKRHGLWIEEGYIVFDCLLDDVDNYHLPDIRQSVTYANNKSRELAEARRAESERAREDTQIEQQELAALRARIRGGEESESAHPDLTPPAPPVDTPPPAPAASSIETEFEERRKDWRTRFRIALAQASRKKESDRDNN